MSRLAAFACLAVSAPALAQPDFDALEGDIPVWLEASGAPAVGVAYVQGGRVVWSGVWGMQDERTPATADTLFNTASLAKPVAAETILRLAADGAVELDAPMASAWVDPDVAEDDRHRLLTARLALSHQTGFPNWRRMNEDGRLAFRHAPGEGVGYSGEGFDYAARYAQARTGTPFAELMRREVLAPSGAETGVQVELDAFADRYAQPKGPDGEFGEPSFSPPFSAADDLWITVEDYGRLLASMMRADGLTPGLAAARQSVIADQTAAICNPEGPFAEICPDEGGFGLGRIVFRYGEETVAWHGGGDWGERAVMFYVPERDLGLVILTNGASGGRLFAPIAERIYDNADFIDFLRIQGSR